MTLLDSMMNDASQAENRRGKVVYLRIDEIKPNKLNLFPMSDIDRLAENIAENGLIEPLNVMLKDGEYVLTSGHRRLEAIKQVTGLWNKPLIYAGKELDGEVPVIIVVDIENQLQERERLLQSNAKRSMGTEDTEKIIAEAYKCCLEEESNKGGTINKKEWIAMQTGFSERTVQTYLNKINGKQTQGEDIPMYEEEAKPKPEKSEGEKLLKRLTKECNYYDSEVNTSVIRDEVDSALQQEINDQIDQFIRVLEACKL